MHEGPSNKMPPLPAMLRYLQVRYLTFSLLAAAGTWPRQEKLYVAIQEDFRSTMTQSRCDWGSRSCSFDDYFAKKCSRNFPWLTLGTLALVKFWRITSNMGSLTFCLNLTRPWLLSYSLASVWGISPLGSPDRLCKLWDGHPGPRAIRTLMDFGPSPDWEGTGTHSNDLPTSNHGEFATLSPKCSEITDPTTIFVEESRVSWGITPKKSRRHPRNWPNVRETAGTNHAFQR